MNILYVAKQERGSFFTRNLKEIRDRFLLHHRVGFFLASLMTVSAVKIISFRRLQTFSKESLKKYDAIIFNYECCFRNPGYPFESLADGFKQVEPLVKDIPRVLFISSPSAKTIASDELLDKFQLVFKREPYKDFDKYKLTSTNKEKISPTILSCPLVPSHIFNYTSIKAENYGEKNPSQKFEQDVFFLGQATADSRKKIIQAVQRSGLNFFGGLHTNVREPDMDFPDKMDVPRLSKKDFYEVTRKSKINLALEGYGAFTYRHWEVWGLASFMISSASVLDVILPFHIEDGVHLVTFENEQDLIDKTEYYLAHDGKREEIARNGRMLFEAEYDFHKHGKNLEKSLETII